MHINLSPEIEQYLQNKVGEGFYGNASEVVRDAIRRMREEDAKLAALQRAIQAGDEQIDAGKAVAYTQDSLHLMTEKALANAKKGKKTNADVTG